MFTSNQIVGIVSETVYSVVEQIKAIYKIYKKIERYFTTLSKA